ncbi:MAG: DEAD/DEAH box helicase [Gemmobacter sp.]|nr:DEAD/DEAH box helicase [Gemmobacter sp.]
MTTPAAFDRLAHPLRKWIRSQGWAELRPLQVRAIHAVMDGDDDQIIAAATAGGKTEAVFLPLISQVLDVRSSGGFELLYIGPLKALITDQARRLHDICAEADIRVTPWHGDIGAGIKARALRDPQGILLITPESLEALFVRRGIEIPRLFAGTRAVVIDELHTMLESERGTQLRSLMNRLDARLGRRLRRIGLSATLGDMQAACAVLQPDAPDSVGQIRVDGGGELQVQLRGYLSGAEEGEGATADIAAHLFAHLRGRDNLVFAGSRQSVEIYADRLRQLCEDSALPNEFYAHHANLSREHRDFVEQRLKAGTLPTSAVCTSTLELGIDIGEVACVAQIGAPFSVAALRQRLGRSGRRAGQPAILRQYAVEARLSGGDNISDRLRLGLLRAIAMIELLVEGWCEPPDKRGLHLSTLVHQVLSVIAERGGITAAGLHRLLCQQGPFRNVDATMFGAVLHAIGRPEAGLIEQEAGGLLLPGPVGERLLGHHSFYAVFHTPEEYRLLHDGQELGMIPVDNVLAPGMLLIFSGRRWHVRAVHPEERIVEVEPARAGTPPVFGGEPGRVHDRVVARMFDLLEGDRQPVWLNKTALSLLREARQQFTCMPLHNGNLFSDGPNSHVIATRYGTVRTTTLALTFQAAGYLVQQHDGILELSGPADLIAPGSLLSGLAKGKEPVFRLEEATLTIEKYHPWLTPELRNADAMTSRLDPDALQEVCRTIIGW